MSGRTTMRDVGRYQEDRPRQTRLSIARVDPWSVMKVSFLLSVAFGIASVVLAIVVWFVLDGMDVFGTIEDFLNSLTATQLVSLLDYVKLPRVISFATITAVINVIILTALCTLAAVLYNLVASLVGGVRITLVDE